MTAATPAPVHLAVRMARVKPDLLAAQWERLGHAFNAGWIEDEVLWRAVDALAPALSQQDRTFWFEQLHTALADRDEPPALSSVPPDERDPDLLEADAIRRIDEAIDALTCGSPPWLRHPNSYAAYLAIAVSPLPEGLDGGAR